MNMRRSVHRLWLVTLLLWSVSTLAFGERSLEGQIADSITSIANSYTYLGKINVISITPKSDKVVVVVNDKLAQIPFRAENVKHIYDAIRSVFKGKYSDLTLVCETENKRIEDLIPNLFRAPNEMDSTRLFKVANSATVVTNLSRLYSPSKGLTNRNIALWQSHGRFYEQKKARWQWQRARVMQTVEDLYTQSYVLPYLVPMLENAGASVFMPRERDLQAHEVIVDNDVRDRESRYREITEEHAWYTGLEKGFANSKETYLFGENPFRMGTYRQALSVTDHAEISRINWVPHFPETGKYAVYVSYKTLPNSASDAHYTVYHNAGKTEFTVNQTMCGGTWVYLGSFDFDKGRSNHAKVVLTNLSKDTSKVITADAVKFGGGMGNMARSPYVDSSVPTQKSIDSLAAVHDTAKTTIIYQPEVSGYPRFAEAARYWLQWAGVPDSIYSRTHGKNDYSDDFQSRGFWVNYLAGGSTVAPQEKGLGVPLDMAFAFHTDAGITPNDSIIGTLGICTIQNSDGATVYRNGVSRWASRDLTDIIQSQIVNDVKIRHSPEWIRRGLWNKSYSESRVPVVPTMLLELLSHQNLADMRYGLDPRFRFTVSRAIYKGMLKYLSAANGFDYQVQPLPVTQLYTKLKDNVLELKWSAVVDSLEPTAKAKKYIVYKRIDGGVFDQGTLIDSAFYTLRLQPGKIYSFKVTALNDGGESFPSEIVSACSVSPSLPVVMIVNGFDRVSAPSSYDLEGQLAGFDNVTDPGMPYLSDISFVGNQYEFKRNKPYESDDAPGFGASHANFETKIIAGNTFDYPYLHGVSIKNAGYSFVSCSANAVMEGKVDLTNYGVVDLILGAQKQTVVGNPKNTANFKVFPTSMQLRLKDYCHSGGNLIVSGAYLASDSYLKENVDDRAFLENVLKIKYRTDKACVNGEVKTVNSPANVIKPMEMSYYSEPNAVSYFVPSADAIEPIGKGGYTISRYAENNLSAGVSYSGKYKLCAFGFPIELIKEEKDRDKLMEMILKFFFTADAKK